MSARRGFVASGALAGLLTLLVLGVRRGPSPQLSPPLGPPAPPVASSLPETPALEPAEEVHDFRPPSGEPSALTCEEARTIVAQARRQLAYEPTSPTPKAFADSTADWLDPHGLWSAAPDAPVAAALARRGRDLLQELEAEAAGDEERPCTAATEVGATLASWLTTLRRDLQKGRAAPGAETFVSASREALFETGAVTRPGRALATLLGKRLAVLEGTLGAGSADLVKAAQDRFLPEMDRDRWAKIVLAAAVRAYVPLVDPHGAWAPADEEASVYEVDLEVSPPERLWERTTRTALGVRVEGTMVEPLIAGDILVRVGGVAMAGLPLEQVDQLALAVADGKAEAQVTLLRQGETSLRTVTLKVRGSRREDEGTPRPGELATQRVHFGRGDVLVVSIPDVHDDLGDELGRALAKARVEMAESLVGVVLDLRGNGGGSTDGAIAALGLFLPGAQLFPMRRRDGTVETDRAPEPSSSQQWALPVATLVDGDTASAAEMIAGALMAYHRGPSLGLPTFGKGCAQEYLDDDARAGVLRLTTLLYALPDGTAVQRVGLVPTLRVPFAPSLAGGPGVPREREALLPHAPPSWRGPDVRDEASVRVAAGTLAWPGHENTVGPCKDADVCRALRTLGALGGSGPGVGATPPSVRRVSSLKPR